MDDKILTFEEYIMNYWCPIKIKKDVKMSLNR